MGRGGERGKQALDWQWMLLLPNASPPQEVGDNGCGIEDVTLPSFFTSGIVKKQTKKTYHYPPKMELPQQVP